MEFSWPWVDSTVDYDPQIGDGRKITAEEFANYFLTVYGPGVIPKDNELEVTSPGANQISVDTGWAICAGRLYHNDAALALAPASAGAETTRQDSVILQCDWAGAGDTEQYTVRAVTKQGTAGAPPSLTQSVNTLWEERLYNYVIDDAGAISGITDMRTYVTFNTVVDEDNLAASVAGDGLTGGAGSALAVSVDDSTIEINTDALRVKDNGITAAKLAHDLDATGIGFNAAKVDGYSAAAVAASGVLLACNGDSKLPTSITGDADTLDGYHAADVIAGGVITGAIVAWYGTIGGSDGHRPLVGGATPNEDWHICNGDLVGAVQTPNLQGLMIAGVGGTLGKTLGQTGGAVTANLAHTHDDGSYAVASHSHADGTLAVQSHSHSDGTLSADASGITTTVQSGSGASPSSVIHTHGITGNTGNASPDVTGSTAAAAPSVTGTSGSGGSATQDIMPPYMALYWIMKIA